jgi:hypothetical protein
MSSVPLYTSSPDSKLWVAHPSGSETVFTWEYDDGRDKLLALYEKGKAKQWNATNRIDWSQTLDEDNPLGVPDEYLPLYGTPIWETLDEAMRHRVKRHSAAWQMSQFLHGEQGALICTAKIVQSTPQIDAKFYAATQVVDEARHVEAFKRFLHEKVQLAYPCNPHLSTLMKQVVEDARWDFTQLGMQVIIEGLALAAFQLIRDIATNPLAQSITAYVMQDEARHVAFGRLALRDFYPELTEKERDEREEFVVEACFLMRDRFLAEEVWAHLGLPKECTRYVAESASMREFRKFLFSRIVPTIKDIGLFGPKVRRAFEQMEVLQFAEADVQAMSDADEAVGEAFDEQRLMKLADATSGVIRIGAAE